MQQINQFIKLARKNEDIAILWLYGSRADGTFQKNSDYDLAIAFKNFLNNPLETVLRPEMLALQWQSLLNIPEKMLSIVDINRISIAFAFEIIQYDKVLYCHDERRLWCEENRIYSRMELDIIYSIKIMRDKNVLEIYLYELNQQVDNYIFDLNELAELESINNRDYYAIERLLQVLVEACVGISKHWLKSLKKTVSNDAYKAFELLVQCHLLAESELIIWRKIIGLRNALVHDYLNLDRRIVLSVLHERHYLKLNDFIKYATTEITKCHE